MTKSDIASHIADKCDVSKKAAGEILDELVRLTYRETKKNKKELSLQKRVNSF